MLSKNKSKSLRKLQKTFTELNKKREEFFLENRFSFILKLQNLRNEYECEIRKHQEEFESKCEKAYNRFILNCNQKEEKKEKKKEKEKNQKRQAIVTRKNKLLIYKSSLFFVGSTVILSFQDDSKQNDLNLGVKCKISTISPNFIKFTEQNGKVIEVPLENLNSNKAIIELYQDF
ncbi:hypothetical protein M0811_10077 [Anaeramoeba ignava]|uniref:Uncharacterized protein n=1 Tax=Anaeramoeba ignava TaxID=1746090 RepID=A0A9Q0R9Q8_ANAIG|nr:hypothetical protein M0811_10077 [Anaeramoeba ignava]